MIILPIIPAYINRLAVRCNHSILIYMIKQHNPLGSTLNSYTNQNKVMRIIQSEIE